MKLATFTLLICALFGASAFANNFARTESLINQNSESMAASCVSIKAQNGSWGSGVIVSESGLVFSAAHVYQSIGENVTVYLSKGRTINAKVIKRDRANDIAVLKLAYQVDLVPAKVQRKQSITAGRTLVAAGHASGYNHERPSPLRVGFGFIARKNDMIYSTCRITAGDSGGPLYDEAGTVHAVHHTMDGKGKFSSHVPVQRFFQLWPELLNAIAAF